MKRRLLLSKMAIKFFQISFLRKSIPIVRLAVSCREVASRLHIEQISLVLKDSIEKAGVSMEDVDAIAFTQGPGLIRIFAYRRACL
jgi:hypothetical protein